MRIPIVGAIVFLIITSPAVADPGLKDLKQIGILVEKLDKDAEACGLKDNEITSAVELPLRAFTRLKLEAGYGHPTLLVRFTVLHAVYHCVISTEFELVHWMSVRLPYQTEGYFATITIYSTGYVAYSPKGNTASTVKAIEDMARRFALAWQKENPNR